MILDSRNEFSDAQAPTVTAAAVTVSDNQIDLGTVSRDIGMFDDLYLCVTVDTDIASAVAGTLQIDLVSDDNVGMTSPTIHASTTLTTGAASDANKTKAGSIAWLIEMPSGQNYQRYLAVQYTPIGQNLTGGKLNAFLTPDKHGNRHYPDAAN